MSFHPDFVAIGTFQTGTDPVLGLLERNERMGVLDVARALKRAEGAPVPYTAIVGGLESTDFANDFCDFVGVDPRDPTRRRIDSEKLIASLEDWEIRQGFEDRELLDMLEDMVAYAKAGATILVVG